MPDEETAKRIPMYKRTLIGLIFMALFMGCIGETPKDSWAWNRCEDYINSDFNMFPHAKITNAWTLDNDIRRSEYYCEFKSPSEYGSFRLTELPNTGFYTDKEIITQIEPIDLTPWVTERTKERT